VHLCPTEIWDRIFSLVCDPTGMTAAAISRVSRYFYKIVGPYRLRSLVIHGESQIMAFNRAMKVMPSDVPRARHLCISLTSDNVRNTQRVCHSVTDEWIRHIEETQDKRDLQRIQSGYVTEYGYYPPGYGYYLPGCPSVQQASVNGIISQHRKTLKTLTYITTVSHISLEMFGRLPNLRDLTIVSLCYGSRFEKEFRRKTEFPRLERLHLSCFDTKPLFDYDEFRRVAPKLTHLRISGRECYPQYEKLPLRTMVLLQPIQIRSWEQERQLSHIRGILSVPSYKERTVLLEPGHREHGRYGFFDALLDWLDVSAGGNAFWGQDSTVTVDDLAASYR
jgi:hypothetical protein